MLLAKLGKLAVGELALRLRPYQPRGGTETSTIGQKPVVFYRVEELTPDNLERPNTVFHLHGSLLDPTSMILTTQDYVRHYANDRRVDGPDGENRVLTFLAVCGNP